MDRVRLAALGAALAALAVAQPAGAEPAGDHAEAFRQYWYGGKAELTRFELEQSRYGEPREGDAVLISVTEDFLPDEQVKYEGRGPGTNKRSVLKLNFTRKFSTGIYPYSMMTSVFTPVAGGPTLKVTASVQEWCGHTYTQLNRRPDGYRGELHSYFQDEADREIALGDVPLEDEVWTKIRLDPRGLATGEIEIVPGLQSARLAHRPSRAERARATLETTSDGHRVYRLEYPEISRTLEITFEEAFPHAIVSWSESDAGGRTSARRTHWMQLDYWNHNSNEDARYREQLGLK